MKQRILSFALLWGLIILVPLLGGKPGALLLITLAAFLTQLEIYRLLTRIGRRASVRLGLTLGLIISFGAYFGPAYGVDLSMLFSFAVVTTVIAHLFQPLEERVFQRIGATIFGLALAPLLFGFFTRLIMLEEGIALTIWVIGVAKFADVGALLTGKAFGRTKLAPNLSPNKTREGAFGGVLWSVAFGAGGVALFGTHFPAAFTPLAAGLIAIPVAIAGICADLFESAVKREAGVKDSGKLIPGIGGAFDLTDSMLLAAPVGYFLIGLLLRATPFSA
ncbi:MAG: phosphatidate cytidylyltransferase [Opitutales bacterium]